MTNFEPVESSKLICGELKIISGTYYYFVLGSVRLNTVKSSNPNIVTKILVLHFSALLSKFVPNKKLEVCPFEVNMNTRTFVKTNSLKKKKAFLNLSSFFSTRLTTFQTFVRDAKICSKNI